MKTIVFPPPIALVDPISGEPVMEADAPGAPPVRAVWSAKRWAVRLLLNDARAKGETAEATGRLYSVLLPAFSTDGPVQLEDADYARLEPIAKAPADAYQAPLLNAQLWPFHAAFMAATDPPKVTP